MQSTTLDHIEQNRTTLLAELYKRQAVVRDYVRGVARQYATGLYLFGRPGTAKTHTVRAVLEGEIREPYAYQRGHLTPMGLFELIAEHPDEVIVLDDLASRLPERRGPADPALRPWSTRPPTTGRAAAW